MSDKFNTIKNKLLYQPDELSFTVKKLNYINRGKLSVDEAENIWIEYKEKAEENKIKHCKKELTRLFSEYRFDDAEKLYADNTKYISNDEYICKKQQYMKKKIEADFHKELAKLSTELVNERNKSEDSLTFNLVRGELPHSKKKQYDIKIANIKDSEFKKCEVWLSMAAEYIFELWLIAKGLDYIDYNTIDIFHPRDYSVKGVDVDVKTTLGIGRRKIPKYNNVNDINEILIGVGSTIPSTKDTNSRHLIHGIYDKKIYEDIDLELKYYKHDSRYINPCYFSSLEDYFQIKNQSAGLNIPKHDNSLIQDFNNKKHLNALFKSMKNHEIVDYISCYIPASHSDLLRIIEELMLKNKIFLLPHFVADFVLNKIIMKEQFNSELITDIVYSIYMPYSTQRIYIDNLIKANGALDKVRCVNHKNESICQMEIECYMDEKYTTPIPTLKACCSHDQRIKTTFFTYSWKTGETLIYGQPTKAGSRDCIPETCDQLGCGCLTHKHDGRKIGKRSCVKYGESSINKA